MQTKTGLTRRSFIKAAVSMGVGSVVSSLVCNQGESSAVEFNVPTRPFGKTGVNVSVLSLGGVFDTIGNQLMLKQAVKWGVTYWDTANSYGGGRSEEGFGKYFSRFPEDRKKVFLVTKSGAWSQSGTSRHLNLSLERMKTEYIDLFLVHGIHQIGDISGMKQWAEKAKSEGKIRYFGFSTHSNMEECLMDASRMGWIDGIMMTYNFRLMKTDRMRRSVDACSKAGIGLTAMKTQGGGAVRSDSESEMSMAGHFLQKGFTDGQAKLKAVWNNEQISSICSQMPTVSLLMTNVQAAAITKPLSRKDFKALDQYARETFSEYCSGCTYICEPAIDGVIPVGDIMRCLMYARSYRDPLLGKAVFNRIAPDIREKLKCVDYSRAERQCPRKLAIGKLVKEACAELV